MRDFAVTLSDVNGSVPSVFKCAEGDAVTSPGPVSASPGLQRGLKPVGALSMPIEGAVDTEVDHD
ncbi:hypothetical protein [Actinoplanes sp. L3-i22]|uniref:hypothetical protein n=1 Tax=Actinoplanes sp. L3-i22 TaxID=2836373 RepID=UPI001C848283|nr:hypothetical protein [Actinoplanes sp. L3-i22]